MTIRFDQEYRLDLGIDPEAVCRRVVEYALEYIKCPYEAEVSVTFTDNASIAGVNAKYRQIERETDVLSFPMLEYETPGDFSFLEEEPFAFHPETGELLLGDIMISLDKVKEQAEQYGHSVTRELAFLTAHSMLHLFGFDHMEEQERTEMEQKQREILDALQVTR